MSGKLFFMVCACGIAWLAFAAFIVSAAYLHYIMNTSKDVMPLIFGAVISGGGGSWLVNEIINYKPNGT